MSSKEKSEEASAKRAGLPLVTVDLLLSAVEALRDKGGSASIEVLATTMNKGKTTAQLALSSCATFDLVSSEGEGYSLTDFGSTFAAANESDMRNLLRDAILRYEPYHTVLLRIKNAQDNTLPKSDVTKAWFDLFKTGADETRQKYTAAFASICDWCGLVENQKTKIVLKQETIPLLGVAPSTRAVTPSITQSSALLAPQHQQIQQMVPAQPLAASVSINIAIDTHDDNSVRNLIRIIKALRGVEDVETSTEQEEMKPSDTLPTGES